MVKHRPRVAAVRLEVVKQRSPSWFSIENQITVTKKTVYCLFLNLNVTILEVVKRRDAHPWIICVKKIDTISTTIINILKQPKDSCLFWVQVGFERSDLHTSTQTDPTSHRRLPVWKRSGCSCGVEGKSGCRGGRRVFRRGLGTSFNSTLLWKLQLPLSRLAPRPHPSASDLFATQTTPASFPSKRWA